MSDQLMDNAKRKEALKRVILDLHKGGDPEEIKTRFSKLIGTIDSVEIARLEQELIAEGLPVEEVQALCDVHVAVFQGGLKEQASPEMTPGHPVHTFKYENFALAELLKLMDEAIRELPNETALHRARTFVEQLAQIDKLYQRKENLLFPLLERKGVTGPSSVMWATHDEIRGQIKALRRALHDEDADRAKQVFGPLRSAIEQMFYKEEHILYPTALKLLGDAEWLAIQEQSGEIGYALVRPGDAWHPDVKAAEIPVPKAYAAEAAATEQPRLRLDVGVLSPEQINLVMKHLSVDVTFIDEQDVVRYYSAGTERIFTRTPAVIGRRVQNCHPPQSVHIVNRLLDGMKAGTRDSAEFWIHMAGKFIYIQYFAVRDESGKYRGCIEVTQDITRIHALEGERRLLDEA
jgi:uncharacterized protein